MFAKIPPETKSYPMPGGEDESDVIMACFAENTLRVDCHFGSKRYGTGSTEIGVHNEAEN
jgi:hypothetical protein